MRGWGGGVLNKILYERLRSEVHTPPLYVAFLTKEKVTLFVYLLLTNGTPFIYLV